MSSTLPPSEPPADGTSPEILDASGGTAITEPGKKRGGARKGLLIGGGVALVALVGGGAFAAVSFLGTGPQPAEALPAGTLGYASIDLDPSGGQKIEALGTIKKFPSLEDVAGLDAGDDLRKGVFDLIQEQAACPGLDYEDDIEPWIGNRAAIAAVADGDGDPQAAFVIQVTDADAADKGLKTLKACSDAESDQETGWVIDGDWAVLAQSESIAKSIAADADKSSLADDETFQKWTGETGDSGVATLYAAPSAGPAILKQMGADAAVPEELKGQFDDFKGIAATVRFSDGALEMEAAGQTPESASKVIGAASVGDQVGTLPDDTAAVLGLSLGKDWFQGFLDSVAAGMPGGSSEEFVTSIEQATGLSLPEDIETLTGDSLVVAVGPGLDPETIANSDTPTNVPVAVKLTGDPDEIQAVLDKLQGAIPEGPLFLGSSAGDDTVIVGPDETYREELVKGGRLAEAKEFTAVVENPDSPGVFYLNVNAFDTALTSLIGSDKEVLENIEPLSAIGFSTSQEGDTTHFVLRVGTDD